MYIYLLNELFMKGRLKEFWVINEKTILTVAAFASVFLLGFFTGKVDSFDDTPATITIEKSPVQSTIFKDIPQGGTMSGQVAGAATGDCATGQIKGNISSSDKVYHLPGGSFYNRTTAEQCFNSEAEAQAAGFRKSSR